MNNILEKFDLTEDEENFVKNSDTGNTGKGVLARVVANLYLAKTIEDSTNKTIDSNKTHAQAMRWLTGALVLVGILQVAISFYLSST